MKDLKELNRESEKFKKSIKFLKIWSMMIRLLKNKKQIKKF